jgi:Ni2+-binding GTPase involved in maturation of urease and hydrogenase
LNCFIIEFWVNAIANLNILPLPNVDVILTELQGNLAIACLEQLTQCCNICIGSRAVCNPLKDGTQVIGGCHQ